MIYIIIFRTLYGRKTKIIDEVYNDKGGFGSKSRTLNEARKNDKTIAMEDVS